MKKMKMKLMLIAMAIGAIATVPANATTVFTEDFNGYIIGGGGGAQGGTGMSVRHSGNVAGWSKSGWAIGGVQLCTEDWAIILGEDGVATAEGIAANNCGKTYEVAFDYGPSNWTTCCASEAGDGVEVEVLNADDTVLASDTFISGAWVGSNLGFTGTLAYDGDGSGAVRVRFTAVNGTATWTISCSIDNMTVSETGSYEAFCSEPLDGDYNSIHGIAELTYNVPAQMGAGPVTCTVVYGTNGTETVPGILDAGGGNSTDTATTGTVAYAPAVGDHFWQIMVTEPSEATYYSPVYAFTIEPIIYADIKHDTVFFASDLNSYVGTSSGNVQLDTGLEVAHSGEHAGWDSGGTAHAVNLDGAGDWAYMTLNAFTLTQSAAVAANDLGVNYKINFDYGTACYSTAQGTTADNGLLVEVLRGDNTVLASDTFTPGAYAAGNHNLEAGLKGQLTYVGDYTGDVRIRLSKAGAGIFGASVDNVSLTPNWFNHMPTDGDHHAGENITELTHDIPDPNGAGPVTTTVVYGTDGTETVPGILDAGGGNSTLVTTGTGSVPYVPALGDHYWQIKVEEPGQATYYSPVYKFSIVKVGPVAIIGGPVADGTAYHSWTEQGVEQNIFIYDGGSYDPDAEPGDVLTYQWSTTAPFAFGDPTLKDPNIGISDSCGAWNLTLTVTDADGLTGTTTATNAIWFQCEPCNYAIWGHPQDYMWEGENLNPRYRTHQAADVYDNRGVYPETEVYTRNDCRVDENDLLALAAVWLTDDRAYVDGVTPYFDLKYDDDFFCGNPVVGVDIDPNTGMFDVGVIADQWGTEMLLTPPDYSKP